MQEEPYRVNQRIMAREVRVVGEGIQQGVYPVEQAIRMAQEIGLDLVEISPNADPPVCRITDYSKFKYEQKKKEKELRSKAQKTTVLKEIRFGPNTDDHDFDFKRKHAENFLKEGAKVKAYVQFRGRAIVYKERGELLLLRFAESLSELSKVEQMPRLEGKRMFLSLAPKTTAPLKKKPSEPKTDEKASASKPKPKPQAAEENNQEDAEG